MIIQNQETGLSLPPAPEFGSDGTWPPEVTDWVPLRWQLFEARNVDIDAAATYTALRHLWCSSLDNPIFNGDALQQDFLHEFFVWVPTGMNVSYRSTGAYVTPNRLADWFIPSGQRHRSPVKKCDARSPELRRLVHSVRWRRNDPVTKLPPGSTNEMTYSLITGLSIESSMTLADSLGLTLGSKATTIQANLSSELQRQFTLKLNVTTEETRSAKVNLQNSSNDNYRLYSLWHIDHAITVTVLNVGPFNTILADEAPGEHWRTRGSVEFVTESQPHITYTEFSRS